MSVEVVVESVRTVHVIDDGTVTQVLKSPVRVVQIVDEGPQGPPGDDGAAGGSIAPIAFSYGDASPSTIYTTTDAGTLTVVRVVIDTALNGTGAALKLGTIADDDALMTTAENDPSTVADYETTPDLHLSAGTVVRLTITPGSGATQGAGRVLLTFIPD